MRNPGTGEASLNGFLRGTRDGGAAGLELNLEAKLEKYLGVFATGRVGHAWGDRGDGLMYEAIFGGKVIW